MNDWHIDKSGCEDQAEKNGKNPTEDQKYSWHPGTDIPDTGSWGVFKKLIHLSRSGSRGHFGESVGSVILD